MKLSEVSNPTAMKLSDIGYQPTVTVDAVADTKSGVPFGVRQAVGGARSAEDKLATLRQWYPDATPYGDDNFLVTDPQTGRPTLVNPPGLDVGDIGGVAPELAEIAGGTIGGVVGAPAGPMGAIAGVGLGAAIGKEYEDMLAQTIGGRLDSRPMPQRIVDAGVTAGVNSAGQKIASKVEEGVKSIYGAVRGGGGRALQDFAGIGVQPMAGMATGNRGVQTLEHALSNTPGGASWMQEAARTTLEGLQNASGTVARSFGQPGTAQEAGSVIKSAAKGAGERFAARQQVLDSRLDDLIGKDTLVPVTNARELLKQLKADIARAPNTQGEAVGSAVRELEALVNDAPTGMIRFSDLRAARSSLGKALETPDVTGYSGRSMGALRRAYGAMREDIRQAADLAGPNARKALDVHDRYVRYNRNINLDLLDKIDKLGADEQAYKFAIEGSANGGTRLLKLRKNFTPDEWNTVAATAFENLGRSRPGSAGATEMGDEIGEFSVNTFMTNWNKMSPEARKALFGGTQYKELEAPMNRLVRSVDRAKESEKMANPSGTARNLIAAFGLIEAGRQGIEGDYAQGAGTIAAGILAPRYAAKLLTNPKFVQWLATGVQLAEKSPASLTSHISRLAMVSKGEPAIREEIQQYLSAIAQPPQSSDTASILE